MNKSEQKTLLELLGEIEDHRQGNGVKYELKEVLMIGILTILCNGMTFKGMEMFGKTHEQELRRFMTMKNGIPSHDTFGDVFSAIDPKEVQRVFDAWLGNMKEEIRRLKERETTNHVVSIDGKTIRRSASTKHKAFHIVTAYCSDLQLVLGQECTDEKSNEITAIPKLLKALELKGCTVTIDAMGTQREIAETIREKGADYILRLKGNQPDMLTYAQQYIEGEMEEFDISEMKKAGRYAMTLEKGHGRMEKRECFLFPGMAWYDKAERWKDAAGVAVIQSTRTMLASSLSVPSSSPSSSSSSTEYRYYIYSRATLCAQDFLTMQRSHWAIENNLHWSLDVTFGEDSALVRIGNAAVVLNIFRKLALQMLKADTSIKDSMRSKMLRCAWDFDFALHVIDACPFPLA